MGNHGFHCHCWEREKAQMACTSFLLICKRKSVYFQCSVNNPIIDLSKPMLLLFPPTPFSSMQGLKNYILLLIAFCVILAGSLSTAFSKVWEDIFPTSRWCNSFIRFRCVRRSWLIFSWVVALITNVRETEESMQIRDPLGFMRKHPFCAQCVGK